MSNKKPDFYKTAKIIFISSIGLSITILLLSFIIPYVTRPNKDFSKFYSGISDYVRSNKYIDKVEVSDIPGNDWLDIQVSDLWAKTPIWDKSTICKDIYDNLYYYAKEYQLIKKDVENINLQFSDSKGEVASYSGRYNHITR